MDKEKKELHSPIIWDQGANDAELVKMSSKKSPEEKLYYIIYTDPVEGNTSCEICEGRTMCYRTIQRLVEAYDYLSPIDMKVLVEIIGIDAKTKKYRWFMMNPSDPKCLNAYQFCKQVENQFDDGFSIDDFVDGEELSETPIEIESGEVDVEMAINQAVFQKDLFGGDQGVADSYATILRETMQSSAEPQLFLHPELYEKEKNLFAKPTENPFEDNKV